MTELKDLERLKNHVETLEREIERDKGRRDEALRSLKEEFDVKSLPEAKTLLKKIIKEEKEGKAAFSTALEEFKSKWNERMEKDE